MGYQTNAVELLCSSIIAESEECTISAIVRKLNIKILELHVTGEVYGAKISVSAR